MATANGIPFSDSLQSFVAPLDHPSLILCVSCQTMKPAMDWALSAKDRIRLKVCRECACKPLVYILQLRESCNTFKIGIARHFNFRLVGLRQEYGFFRVLALIPSPQPRKLEKQFHAQFQAYRLQHGSHREVFQFNTRAGQQALLALFVQYAACVRALPRWTLSVSTNVSTDPQLVLL